MKHTRRKRLLSIWISRHWLICIECDELNSRIFVLSHLRRSYAEHISLLTIRIRFCLFVAPMPFVLETYEFMTFMLSFLFVYTKISNWLKFFSGWNSLIRLTSQCNQNELHFWFRFNPHELIIFNICLFTFWNRVWSEQWSNEENNVN